MKRVAFIKPYTKFSLNIKLFRKVVLVELRVNDISQCRRSYQRVAHVQNLRRGDLRRGTELEFSARTLGELER